MGEPRDEAQNWLNPANTDDIVHVYRLFQRREPDQSALEDSDTLSLGERVRIALLSDEFLNANIGPLKTDHVPLSSLHVPLAETLQWIHDRLPLSRASHRKLKKPASFLQAYHVLLCDPGVRDMVGDHAQLFDTDLLARMGAASRLQGMMDMPHGRQLTGWARGTDAPNEPVHVEVWADGWFVGRTSTGLYRHDLVKRYGSHGRDGFSINLPDTLSGTRRILIREVSTQLILVDFEMALDQVVPADFDVLRSELNQLRGAIEAIENRLPERLRSATSSLDQYGSYYDTWLRNIVLSLEVDQDAHSLVLVDGIDVAPAELEDALLSLAAQRHQNFRVVVGLRQKTLAFLHDLMARLSWRSTLRIDYVVADSDPAWRTRIEVADEVAVVQLMRANGTLHADALRCMAEPFASDPTAAAVYCDEDHFLAGDLGDWSRRAHSTPVLKPAFDDELLVQTPYVGDFVAFGRETWLDAQRGATPLDYRQARLEPARLILALSQTQAQIVHQPQVLFTRGASHDEFEGQSWRAIVAAHLGQRASVEPHTDILGAEVTGASRIRWRVPDSVSAGVIIPTRDRIDLLKPCLDSVLASLPANRTRTKVRVIDHESTRPETAEYLASVDHRDDVEVQSFSGAFNWALMNNLAAQSLDKDVLIFLNNDTIVITPEWIDELTSLAMRDDVGVVGCRLIYEDGAIQHAGFVALDSQERFLTHEGVGDAGSGPGYLGRHALTHQSVAVTGACMAVRREVFQQVGGFDAARLPIDSNDVDFCFRVAQAGLKVLYSPAPTLYHLESRSRPLGSAGEQRMQADARAQLWARWGDKVCPDRWYNPRFSRDAEPFSHLLPT